MRIGQPLVVRPTDPQDRQFEETNTTRNVSREGIYFISRVDSYYEGMRLFVTVPHHSPRAPQDREYLGQVARVERLPDGQWGIAVQFLSGWSSR